MGVTMGAEKGAAAAGGTWTLWAFPKAAVASEGSGWGAWAVAVVAGG